MQYIIDFVSEFTKITEEEIQFLTTKVQIATFKKNELIIQQGQIVNKMGLIIKGAVRGFYLDEYGSEQTIGFTFENQPLASLDTFTHQTPSGLSAMAIEPIEILWISHADFFDFLNTYPRFEVVLRNVISQYQSIDSAKHKLLRINSSKDRYAALVRSEPDVINRVPLKYIASYLGMTLENLSRIRSKYKK